VRVAVEIVQEKAVLDRFGRPQRNAKTGSLIVDVVIVLPGDDVLCIAVARIDVECSSKQELVGDDWNIYGTLFAEKIIVSEALLIIAAKFVRRPLGLQKDGAACCVASEQGSLRSLEDLDRLQIEQLAWAGRNDRNFCEISQHRWLRSLGCGPLATD